MKALPITWLLILTLPTCAVATPKPNGWNSYSGSKSCGAWTAAEDAHDHIEQIEQHFWLSGFLAGFNAFGSDPSGDVTAQTDSDGVTGWMTAYCLKHPLETQATAAVVLVGELQRR